MPVEVILPKVDMDMTHGTLAVWHIAEGEMVAKGAALFDIETDKAAMEVEAPASGRLISVTARPGDRVPVGSVVALILAEGEVASAPVCEAPAPVGTPAPAAGATAATGITAAGIAVTGSPAPAAPATAPAGITATGSPANAAAPTATASTGITAIGSPATGSPATGFASEPAPAPATPPDDARKSRATPAARAAARQAGLALHGIHGSGPLGRIQRCDVPTGVEIHPADAAPQGWTPQPGPLAIRHRRGNGPTLVLLHGFTADSQSWTALEKVIGPGPTLIRIDLPCHGKSPLRRIGSFAALSRMMVDAFDDATRDIGPVHLIGHSLGGALAIAIADIRPRRVSHLSLIAPAGLGPDIDAATLNGIIRATRAESLAPWLRRLTATPGFVTDSYAEAAMRMRSDAAMRAAQSDMAQALFADGTQTFDLNPALHRLTVPTRIIWGRKDRIIPWRHALSHRTDAAIHLMDNAGHIPHAECPDRLARVIGLADLPDL